MEFSDPNANNLVGMVSSKQPKTYKPDSGETKIKVIAVDVGMVCAARYFLFALPVRCVGCGWRREKEPNCGGT